MMNSSTLLAPQKTRGAALIASLTLAAALALSATQVQAQDQNNKDLIVTYDQSQILLLSRPAAEIIIGNPAVADVAIQTGNMLVITGKSFGITNIIALDAERKIIQDQRVMVKRDEKKVVHIYKAASRYSYNCAPQCNASIVPGDDNTHFSQSMSSANAKMGFNEKAADSAAASGGQQ